LVGPGIAVAEPLAQDEEDKEKTEETDTPPRVVVEKGREETVEELRQDIEEDVSDRSGDPLTNEPGNAGERAGLERRIFPEPGGQQNYGEGRLDEYPVKPLAGFYPTLDGLPTPPQSAFASSSGAGTETFPTPNSVWAIWNSTGKPVGA